VWLLVAQGCGRQPRRGAATIGNLTICKRRSSRYQARQSLGGEPGDAVSSACRHDANFD